MSDVAYAIGTTANASARNTPLVLIFDARGNGGGTISPTIAGDHQNRITDYTAIVVEYDQDVDRETLF